MYEKSLSLCSGKAAEHERDYGNGDEGLDMLRSGLVVADQAALLDEPAEGPLDDPAPVEHLEAFGIVRAPYDVQVEAAAGSQGFYPGDQGAGIARVGPDLGQAAVPIDEAPQQGPGSIPVLFIGGADIDPQQQAQDVDQDMAFASRGLLTSVVAAHPALVTDLDGLAVEDGGGGTGLTAVGLADLGAQGVMDTFPDALLNPEAKHSVDGAPRAVLFGQQSPGAAGTQQIKNTVDHQAPVGGRSPELGRRGQQRAQQVPVGIDLIGRIDGMCFHTSVFTLVAKVIPRRMQAFSYTLLALRPVFCVHISHIPRNQLLKGRWL